MSNQQIPQASGIRSWVGKLRFLPLVLIVCGAAWVLSHPFKMSNAAAAGTISGQVNSVDASDIVAHTSTQPSVVLGAKKAAKPELVIARADVSNLASVTAAPAQPLPVAVVTPYAPPPAAAPTAPPTLSPAAIAAQRRAEEDRAALDAPLTIGTPPGGAQAQAPAQVASAQQRPASDYDVAPPSGTFLGPHTEIDVTLYTSIDSTIPGAITGFVGRDVLDFYKRVVLIPANSKVVGRMVTTTMQPGQNRIGAIWDGVLLPNGHEILLDAPGIDLTGTTGFGAAIDNHTRKEILNVIAFSILAAGAQLAQPQNNGCNSNGFGCTPSVGQAIGQAVGTQIANLSTQAYNRASQIPPTAHVVEGAQVGVMITNYLPIRPWDPTAQ